MASDSSIRSTTIFGHRSDCCSLDQWCGKGSAGSTQTSPILGPGQRLNPNQPLKARALSLRPSHTFQQPQCFWAPVTASWSSEAAVWGGFFWFYLCFHQRPHNSMHSSSRAVEAMSLVCQSNSSNLKCKLNPPLWCKSLLSGVPQTSKESRLVYTCLFHP